MNDCIFYLSTCTTCQRILKEIRASQFPFELQDIKTMPLSPSQLDYLKKQCGSYEALFSRRSRQYIVLGLASKTLTEADYKQYLLAHYSFLKRPVVVWKGRVFVGSDKSTIAALKTAMEE